MAHERSKQFSNEFKDLILRLIQPKPKHRLTIEGIKNHVWYTQNKIISDEKELKNNLDQRRKIVLKKKSRKN